MQQPASLVSYNNDGGLNANGGVIEFDSADAYSIAAGSGEFADVLLSGLGAVNITENATATGQFTIATSSDFTLDPSTTLAVGGQFVLESTTTDWTATLFLYGGGNYTVMEKTISETFGTLAVGANTQIRLWNSQAATTTVNPTGSVYSQDHAGVDGDLYVWGSYESSTYNDHWSYATDFDGADLATTSSERQVDVSWRRVRVRRGPGEHLGYWYQHRLNHIQNQGSGTYSLTAWRFERCRVANAVVRDIDLDGMTFSWITKLD